MSSCEPCMRHGRQVTAEYHCQNCTEAMCCKCRQDHTKFRQFIDHTIEEDKSLKRFLRDRPETADTSNPSYRKSNYVRVPSLPHPPKTGNEDVSQGGTGYVSMRIKNVKEHIYTNENSSDEVTDGSTYLTPVPVNVNIPEPRHFQVIKVMDTELAQKVGIGGTNGYITVTAGHVIFTSIQSCVSISFPVIRRFSIGRAPKHLVRIEVGRRFRHSEGLFEFATKPDDAWSLFNYCNETAGRQASLPEASK